MKREAFIIFGLIAITLTAFGGIGQCDFVKFDDFIYVVDNLHVTRGLSAANFAWAWKDFDRGTYIPLTWLSLMLDATLFSSGPHGFHWVNLAFHIANAILVYLFFRLATGTVWRSALVAAIFAVHPLRVESVAWVVERKDVLSTFLGLLAMLAYLNYARSLKLMAYIATVMFFTASLLAKQSLTTLPFLLLLIDYWPLQRWRENSSIESVRHMPRRSLRRLILEKLPLLAIAGLITLVAMKVQAASHGQALLDPVPLADRLRNALVSYVRYLGKMVWFGNLAVFYPRHSWSNIQVTGACLLLVTVTAFCLWKLRSSPWLTVGWFWFLGALLPMIGIIEFGKHALADRFTYFSGIGMSIMLAWSIPARWWRAPIFANTLVGFGLSLLMLFTIAQIRYWRDTVSLFERNVQVADSETVELNLGAALFDRGNREAGLRHLEKAVSLNPQAAATQGALAEALANAQQPAEALPHCAAAIRAEPNNAHWHIAMAYILMQEKRYEAAARQCRVAIALNPQSAQGYRILGLALCEMDEPQAGIQKFETALSIQPDFKEAQNDLQKCRNSLIPK